MHQETVFAVASDGGFYIKAPEWEAVSLGDIRGEAVAVSSLGQFLILDADTRQVVVYDPDRRAVVVRIRVPSRDLRGAGIAVDGGGLRIHVLDRAGVLYSYVP